MFDHRRPGWILAEGHDREEFEFYATLVYIFTTSRRTPVSYGRASARYFRKQLARSVLPTFPLLTNREPDNQAHPVLNSTLIGKVKYPLVAPWVFDGIPLAYIKSCCCHVR